MELLISSIAALLIFDILAVAFGRDSRDGFGR